MARYQTLRLIHAFWLALSLSCAADTFSSQVTVQNYGATVIGFTWQAFFSINGNPGTYVTGGTNYLSPGQSVPLTAVQFVQGPIGPGHAVYAVGPFQWVFQTISFGGGSGSTLIENGVTNAAALTATNFFRFSALVVHPMMVRVKLPGGGHVSRLFRLYGASGWVPYP